jgi:hypothetical protein
MCSLAAKEFNDLSEVAPQQFNDFSVGARESLLMSAIKSGVFIEGINRSALLFTCMRKYKEYSQKMGQ